MNANELQQTLPIGTILKSPKFEYRIEEVLGKGGFGITYKVSTTVMFDKVPIFTYFTIKEHFVKDACERAEDGGVGYSKPLKSRVEESRADFLSEARRLNEISGKNPNVVPVSEVFEANNTVYYVMEYLNGGSLRDMVVKQGALSEEEALDIIRPVASAVAFLHGYKINHLDIKPDNVMFRVDYHTGARVPVLIDFGLAKHFDSEGHPTSTIRVQGCSDGYAPVEQYSGLQTFSPQADVYAIGATFYYMLVGKAPVIATELQSDTVSRALPDSVSDTTRQAIVKAMRYNRNDRTPTVVDFLSDLEPAQEAELVQDPEQEQETETGGETRPIGGYAKFDKKKDPEAKRPAAKGADEKPTVVIGETKGGRSMRWLLWVAVGLVAVAVAIGGWFVFSGSESRDEDEDNMDELAEIYATYTADCDRCDSLVTIGTDSVPDVLLDAKDLLSKVKDTERRYAGESEEYDFDRSESIEPTLNLKLQSAHDAWVETARSMLDIGFKEDALKWYRLAYRLDNSDEEAAKAIGRLESELGD